jgi:hypothetical protein
MVDVHWRMIFPSRKNRRGSIADDDRTGQAGIGARISGQIHVEDDSATLRRDFYFARCGGEQNGVAAL